LSVTAAVYPIASRNFNTGEAWANAIMPRVANMTIHHGTDRPSRLMLPVER
jgi:hypothetical protein